MPEFFEQNQQIILETDERELKSCAERLVRRIEELEQSRSKLAKEDGRLYRRLLSGEVTSFQGLYVYRQIPRPENEVTTENLAREALATVFVETLGLTAWVILADAEQTANLSDTQLTIALIEEISHARDKIKTIEKKGRLSPASPTESRNAEIRATQHVLDVYRELAKSGFYDEVLDNLSTFLSLREQNLRLQGKKENEILVDRNNKIEKFLATKGYQFRNSIKTFS